MIATFSVSAAQAPVIAIVRTITILEDSGRTNIAFSVSDADSDVNAVTITPSSSNTALVPAANLEVTGSGANRTLSIAPVADGFGTATIQLIARDGQASSTNSLTLTVTAVNDAPSFGLSTNLVIVAEDTSAALTNFVTAISAGPANESSQTLQFVLTTEDRAFFEIQPAIDRSGKLTFKPAVELTGTNALSVILQDSGGVASGGTNRTAPQSFRIVVTPVNDAPSVLLPRSLSILEDSGTTNINILVTDPDSDVGTVSVTASSSNTALVPNANLSVTGTGTNRVLQLTALTNAFGTASIQLVAADSQGAVSTNSFPLTVVAVNDPPSFELSTNRIVAAEDTLTIVTNFATGIRAGPANETSQQLSFLLTVTNRALYAVLPKIASDGTLNFKPAANTSGSDEITAILQDNGGTSFGGTNATAPQTFTIVVSSVNDPPVLSIARSVVVNEDAGTTNVAFTVRDLDSDTTSIVITPISSNASLAPETSLQFSGTGTNRTLAITPLSNANGNATIQLIATDAGGASSTNSFILLVNAVNDAPSFVLSTNRVTVTEETPLALTNFVTQISAGPDNESGQSLVFLVTTTNGAFYAIPPRISASGTLSFKPAANVTGTNEVRVVLQDGGGTALGGTNQSSPATFSIVVGPVNDTPKLVMQRTLAILEDSPTTNISFTIRDPDSDLSAMTFDLSSSNPALMPVANLAVNGTDGLRTLAITPVSNAFGTATIELVASDSLGARATNSLLLIVNAVNDPPSFALSTNVVTAFEDASFVLTNFATNIRTGPDNESSQTLQFLVTTEDRSFYRIPPSINRNGTLAFKPGANVTGTNELTVVLSDSGGVAFGGTNRSAPQSFKVVVAPSNDPPSLLLKPSLTIPEDIGTTNVLLTIRDIDTDPSRITITVTSSNPALVPNTNLAVGVSGTNRTLAITPLPDAFGSATIQLITTDDLAAGATNKLLLTVSPVNDPPSFNLAASTVTVSEDAILAMPNFATNISAGPTNEAAQALSFLLSTDDRSLYSVQPAITANGTLVLRPAANVSGTNQITVVLQDSGGASLGGTNRSAPQTFNVVVTPVNDPPVIQIAPSVIMKENDGTAQITFAVTDVDSELDRIAVTASSSNSALLPAESLVVSGSGADRTLSITPLSNASGSAIIQIIATDDQSARSTNSVRLFVNSVNNPPSFALSTNWVVVAEDTSLTLTNFALNISAGPSSESGQSLFFLLSTSDRSFYSVQPSITATGTLILKPGVDVTGTNEVTVVLQDSGGVALGGTNRAAPETFTVVVTPVNDSPRITVARGVVMNEDSGSTNVALVVNDVDGDPTAVTVTIASSNSELVPSDNITLSGTGSDRTLTIRPLSDAFGNATIQIVATDAQLASSTNAVLLAVNAVNDAPSFDLSASAVTVPEDTLLQVANFVTNVSAGPANESGQSLQFLVTTADRSFYSIQPAINRSGTLTLKPAANITGTNEVTVVLQDSGGTAFGGTNRSETKTFKVIVTAENDSPALLLFRSFSINEDSGTTNLTFTMSDVDSPLGGLSLTVSSSNTNLIPNTNLIATITGSTVSLPITPLTNAFGTAVLTFIASDDQSAKSTNSLFVVVNAVNDPPSFALATNRVSAAKNAGLVQLANFATQISLGPTNEASQRYTFLLTSADNSFFAVRPTINAAGTLSFRTATNVTGTNLITVVLQDTGGVANGGTNRSPAQQFSIVVPGSGSEGSLASLSLKRHLDQIDPSGSEQTDDADTVTVFPRIIDDVLPNPFKGFVTSVADFSEIPEIPQSLFHAEITWEKLEPVRGTYDWAALEAGWRKHVRLGRRVGFRIKLADPWLNHPCDIPGWLVDAGVALRPYSVAGTTGFAPDWDNPVLLAEHDRLIAALGERYNGDPRVAWLDVGSYGLWGEWHLFGNDSLAARPESKQRMLDAYRHAFPDKQLALPYDDAFATRHLTAYAGGLRNDYLGFPRDNAWYLQSLARIEPNLNETLFKRAVVTGQFGNAERGPLAILKSRFEANLDFIKTTHWSWIGPVGGSLVHPRDAVLRANAEKLYKTLGYRFAVVELTHDKRAWRGQPFHLRARIINQGIAPFYYPWPVEISFLGSDGLGNIAAAVTQSNPRWDPRVWTPGEHELSLDLLPPNNALPGRYKLAIAILDAATGEPGVRFANEGRDSEGRYSLSTLEIQR